MYLARGVLEAAALACGRGPFDPDAPADRALAFTAVRILAAVLSCVSLWLVYAIGRLCGDWRAACLGTLFVAVAPVAVQQAHFYTVDGVFAFLVLLFFHALLRALAEPRRWLYVLSGALVGATGAVRLNGLLLGGVLVVGHLLARPPGAASTGSEDASPPRRADDVASPAATFRRRLLSSDLWLAGGAAVLVLLLLQPYLATAPGLLWRGDSTSDFAYSLRVARGEILRPWSLVDVHTLPFLHYWTDLWPRAVGWPLTIALVAGVVGALRRAQVSDVLMLVWVGAYFLLIGGLHTKHVRYLLPLLPFLSLLAASLALTLARVRRPANQWWPGPLLVGLVVAYTGLYGVAFARIYTEEDSRIQAGRWLARTVPAGSRIGLEKGGFSLRQLISSESYPRHFLDLSAVFGTRGYLSCGATWQYLRERLRAADFIAIVDVNRYRQFTAVPDLYPAMASFYQKLVRGEMGFELVRRFKTYPGLGGIEFRDDLAEPSFLGYDHPAVLVFRRQESFAADWAAWRMELQEGAGCGTGPAEQMAAAWRNGDVARALALARDLRRQHPRPGFAALAEAVIQYRLGNVAAEREALKAYLSGLAAPAGTAYLIPWATSLSLVDLGLNDMALEALRKGVRTMPYIAPNKLPDMARSYTQLGTHLLRRGAAGYAREVYELSLDLHPDPRACNALADMAQRDGGGAAALPWWERSLRLDPAQPRVHASLGRLAAELGDNGRALRHLEHAAVLDPGLGPELRDAIAAARQARPGL